MEAVCRRCGIGQGDTFCCYFPQGDTRGQVSQGSAAEVERRFKDRAPAIGQARTDSAVHGRRTHVHSESIRKASRRGGQSPLRQRQGVSPHFPKLKWGQTPAKWGQSPMLFG